MSTPRKGRFVPEFESLEDRSLMSATPSVSMFASFLTVNGGDQADRIAVVSVRINNTDAYLVTASGGGTSFSKYYDAAKVSSISIYGNGGNDTIDLTALRMPASSVACNVDGGDGNDTIHGSGREDWLSGGKGNDIIYGAGGSDILNGDDGNDTLYGNAGWDCLYGGAGDDILRGGADDDVLKGDDGKDTLYGEDGNDQLNGGAGVDTDFSGAGKDVVNTGGGTDAWKDRSSEDSTVVGKYTISVAVEDKWLALGGKGGSLGDVTSSSTQMANGIVVTGFQKGVISMKNNQAPTVQTLAELTRQNTNAIGALSSGGLNLAGYKGPKVSVSKEGINISDPNIDKAKDVVDKAQKAVALGQEIIDKGQTALDQIAKFAHDAIGAIAGAVSSNDYALVKAEYEAKFGNTAGVSNIYFSSQEFTNWASPETVARWVAEGVGSGGAASAAIVEEIKSHLLKEFKGICTWASTRLQAEATNALDQFVQALIKGDDVTLGGVKLSVKMATVNYYYQIPGIKESRVTLPHLGFVIGVAGNVVSNGGPGSPSPAPVPVLDPPVPNIQVGTIALQF